MSFEKSLRQLTATSNGQAGGADAELPRHEMARSIYGLYYSDQVHPEVRRYFYVGRSIDVFRRFKQHNYAKRSGHEDKYEFIRDLEAKGIAWTFEILCEIPDGEYPPDNERWFVIKLTREGHQLMNMRHGSEEHRRELTEQILSPHIRNVADVQRDRFRRRYLASKRLQRKVLKDTLRRDGIPDVSADKLLPRVLHRKLLEEHVKSIEAGITLAEIFRLARGFRTIRAIEARAMRGRAKLASRQV